MMQQSCVSDEPSYDETLGGEIFALLPPLSEAIHLCEVYLQFGKALYVAFLVSFAIRLSSYHVRYTAIPRTELFDEILSSIYRAEYVCHSVEHGKRLADYPCTARSTLFNATTPWQQYSSSLPSRAYSIPNDIHTPSKRRNTTTSPEQLCNSPTQTVTTPCAWCSLW